MMSFTPINVPALPLAAGASSENINHYNSTASVGCDTRVVLPSHLLSLSNQFLKSLAYLPLCLINPSFQPYPPPVIILIWRGEDQLTVPLQQSREAEHSRSPG